MDPLQEFSHSLLVIQKKISYTFLNPNLLILAFIHRSYAHEHRETIKENNERLEFLGDAVLNLVVSEFLYANLPKEDEGMLSKFRSKIVEAPSCEQYLLNLKLESFVMLGKGEKENVLGRPSIYAQVFESLLGAVFLDGGFEKAKIFLMHHFEKHFLKVLSMPLRNFKAELQDFTQKKWGQVPIYQVLKEVGPEHQKSFHIVVLVQNKEVGSGSGKSKKEAEQNAACDALNKLEEIFP